MYDKKERHQLSLFCSLLGQHNIYSYGKLKGFSVALGGVYYFRNGGSVVV
jgi:hypothetical protein